MQGGGIIPIGCILPYMGTDTPDNYLFCNGSTYSKSTYPDLYNVLKTETLPNLDGLFLQGSSTPNQKKSAGLPNITGSFETRQYSGQIEAIFDSKGAFKVERTGGGGTVGTVFAHSNASTKIPTSLISFDASKIYNSTYQQIDSTLYGKSTTVQPPALTVRYIIRAK